jgi:hypothetical protein
MRSGPFALVAAVVAGAPACFDAEVGDAALACDVAADCPEPLFCSAGRCRRGSADDTTPPGVVGGSASLSDPTVRPTGTVTLSFIATEPLGETPRLLGTGLRFGAVADDDGNLVVDVTADRDADEGGHDVTVDLVDVAGNRADGIYLATVVVDATAPAIVGSEVPATVSGGAPLQVTATASEALAAATCTFAPVVGEEVRVDAVLFGGADLGCEAVFGNDAVAIQVEATLTDLAGNRADVDLGSVAIAFLP